MTSIVLIGIGGFLGACSRYLTGRVVNRYWKGSFPMATFIVNITGSFLLGLVICQPELYQTLALDVQGIIGIGFLGAFTTFSTFELEVLHLVEKKKYVIAGLYVILSFLIGFGLAWAASHV
jgi:CrcB protein